MKFSVKTSWDILNGTTTLVFEFHLDLDDKIEAKAFNAGNAPIKLSANTCEFVFPTLMRRPHPDACAFAALKIVSPFVGSTLTMDRPVSEKMAQMIKKHYANIVHINTSKRVRPQKPGRAGSKTIALAFSGGSDSTATSFLLPDTHHLVTLVRKSHPKLGPLEKWNREDQLDDALAKMPKRLKQIPVYTDFPFTSLDPAGKYAVWADWSWYTVPIVLLSRRFAYSTIANGDILGAFLGDETRYRSEPEPPQRQVDIFGALGLDLFQPLGGCPEYVSELICKQNGYARQTTTCVYGELFTPCMRCVKCFRKSLLNHVLDGTKPTAEEIERFNASDIIQRFAKRDPLPFSAMMKMMFDTLDLEPDGLVGEIAARARAAYPFDPAWTRKLYKPYYERNRQYDAVFTQLSDIAEVMSDEEISQVRSLQLKKQTQPIEPQKGAG